VGGYGDVESIRHVHDESDCYGTELWKCDKVTVGNRS